MKIKLVNTKRISISNFTFDSKTNTISFYSTKTNKCWSKTFKSGSLFTIIKNRATGKLNPTQKYLHTLKRMCKNGNN